MKVFLKKEFVETHPKLVSCHFPLTIRADVALTRDTGAGSD